MLRLADDADARVRFQVAMVLGDWDDPRAGRALAGLARRDGDDPWMRAAVMSSATPHVATLLRNSSGRARPSPARGWSSRSSRWRGSSRIAARSSHWPDRSPRRRDPAGATLPGSSPGWPDGSPPSNAGGTDRSAKDVEAQLVPLRDAARVLVRDDSAPEVDRLPAVSLLGRAPRAFPTIATCRRSAPAPCPRELQQAAVAALGRPPVGDPRPPPPGLEGPLPAGPGASSTPCSPASPGPSICSRPSRTAGSRRPTSTPPVAAPAHAPQWRARARAEALFARR